MISTIPQLDNNGNLKSVFNTGDFIFSDSFEYVTKAELKDYANLNEVNPFISTNFFNNITFSGTLNNINSTVFNYLSTVNSSIQNQFDDIYLAFSSFANLINENTFSALNNYFVNINMSGD
jgi:hypothetical protein